MWRAAQSGKMEAEGEILISNYGSLSSRILSLLKNNEFCDLQLQVGPQTYDAHKLILCASSDVFRTMLTNQKWTEAHKQTVELVEEPFCETVFDRFLHYIYSGQLYLSHCTVCPLLTLADKYNVREMIPLCRTYMMENLDAPLNSSCVLQWWENANMRNDVELENSILDYIECNFSKVIQTPDFVGASLDTVEKLLASSRLAVHTEAMIFYGVMVWLQAFMEFQQPAIHIVKEVFERLTRLIRWPMMTQYELGCLQECQDVQRFVQSYSSFICIPAMASNVTSSVLSCEERDGSVSPTGLCKSSTSSTCNSQCLDCNHSSHHDSSPRSHMCQDTFPFSVSDDEKQMNLFSTESSVCERNLYMSRVYIGDYWCTSLTVSNFMAFPRYATQTFFFSTPQTGHRYDDRHLDWEVELCPKGVHFPPAILIGLERDGNKLVDESYVHTVRLSVMSRSPQELPLKVEVNVLIRANSISEPGRSFFERCHRRMCIFDSKYQRHNIDDIVPYEDLQNYLRPDCVTPDLFLAPNAAFTVFIVIRPLPLNYPK